MKPLFCIGGTLAALAACGPIVKAKKKGGCYDWHDISDTSPVKSNPPNCYPFEWTGGACKAENTDGCTFNYGSLRKAMEYDYIGTEGNCECRVVNGHQVDYADAFSDPLACPSTK